MKFKQEPPALAINGHVQQSRRQSSAPSVPSARTDRASSQLRPTVKAPDRSEVVCSNAKKKKRRKKKSPSQQCRCLTLCPIYNRLDSFTCILLRDFTRQQVKRRICTTHLTDITRGGAVCQSVGVSGCPSDQTPPICPAPIGSDRPSRL